MTTNERRPSRRLAALSIIASLLAVPVSAQRPETRPERTDYMETSRYGDVVAFIHALEPSPILHVTTFGYTYEGRPLPLVVVGRDLPDASPESVRATGRTRVYVQGNIHAGEVEGKEALQELLRGLAEGEHGAWLDSLVLLIAPIYNADGNERVSVEHRYRQNGPFGGVGTRENAQGLDLNRDHTKLESAEARSLAAMMQAYDPALMMDLHTTNGTYHGYHLTYAPPLHPNTSVQIDGLLRGSWLPEVTERVGELGWRMYYYGGAYAPGGGERGWYTYSHMPRYNTNYVGLRNRFGILSEAYAYVSFPDRIAATLAFVEENLDFVYRHATEIQRRVDRADAEDLRGRSLALRARPEAGDRVEILMGEVEEHLSPISGRRYRARLDRVRAETMREYGTFEPTVTEVVPEAYYVPTELERVIDLLTLHGVSFTELPAEQTLQVERFALDSMAVAPREYQGHRERAAFGAWQPTEVTLPEGTVVVPMDQPLARLVFALLEPRSDDGVVDWNFVDDALDAGVYPIFRQPAR